MQLIADILLAAGAIGAGFYCFILGRRLNRFNDLKEGVGGAVAVLSSQVDDLTKTLTSAQASAKESATLLTELTTRAEETARKLEFQMASLDDVMQSPAPQQTPPTTQATTSATPHQARNPMFVRRQDAQGAKA